MLTTLNFIETSVGVVHKECCAISAVDTFAIHAKEQVYISG